MKYLKEDWCSHDFYKFFKKVMSDPEANGLTSFVFHTDFMILEKIKEKFLDDVLETSDFRGDLVAVVNKDVIYDVMEFLKTDPTLQFNVLMDLTAVDYLWQDRFPRFDVVYHLFSLSQNLRVRIKAGVDEKEPVIDSLVKLWPIADWFEREVWDMFGIKFKGHPNLKRIMMYDGFQGHALRKDYPITKRQPLIGPKN